MESDPALLLSPELLALPNPRDFRPVALPAIEYRPALAACPHPVDADAWPMGLPFEDRITLSDGVSLRARMFLPRTTAPPPLVLLLHMWGMDADSWDRRAPGFLSDLGERGLAWCAIDLRWHGQSGGEPHCAVYADWQAARQLAMPERGEAMARLAHQGPPLGANVQFLRDLAEVRGYWLASGRIATEAWAIIGASVGANAAWVASGLFDAALHVVVSPYYPSPGFSLMGREVTPFVPRDAIFLADMHEAEEVARMAARTGGLNEMRIEAVKEHGIGLLRRPEARAWVLEHVEKIG